MKNLLPKIDTKDGLFHNGNPATGEQGTRVTETWLNDVQDRLRDIQTEAHYVLQKAGFKPKDDSTKQLYDAIVKIIENNRRTAGTKQKGEVQLSSSTNSNSETEAATSKAVKAAYDKAVDALDKANQVDEATLKKNGNQSIYGVLKAESVNGEWAAYKFGAKQGVWHLEVHPDSHTANNRRFNMKWIPNSGSQVYLAFPHIRNDGEVVAYQSWVNAELAKVRSISNQNTANFANYIPNNKKSNAVDSSSTETVATSRAAKLAYDRGTTALNTINDFKGGNGYIRGLSSNNNIQLRWNPTRNGLELKIDNSELGGIHYSNRAYIDATAGNYGGLRIDRPSNNDQMLMESNGNRFAFIRRNKQSGSNHYVIYTPEKNGTVALQEDFTNPVFTLTNWANSDISLNNITGTRFLSFGDNSLNGLGLPTGADWVGIQIADQGNQKTQIISGGTNNHYIRTNDDLSGNSWTNEKLLTDRDFTYQKIGNFEVRRHPDGTIIQTYVISQNDLADWKEKSFNWAQAFVETPLILTKVTTSVNDDHDAGINVLSKSNKSACYYYLYEHGSVNQGAVRIQFFAIGRWK
ncbi:phage tail protein [Rodentibacter myodis]|uniref:phage tail protein n=1 Tax=Rodentibacter myodis TaxID=1907939 RepID=UPI002449F7E6|nr:phage tail protein [Rodentibacter myodis]